MKFWANSQTKIFTQSTIQVRHLVRTYTTTEKEYLAVVYVVDKFRSYLMGAKS